MGTYKESFINLIKGYKEKALLDYEFYDFSRKKYEENAQSRICHFSLKNECEYNRDAIIMVFTIGENVGRTVIQSEGGKTVNPSSTYPQKMEAIRLAKDNKWKYIALAISSEDFGNETIRNYVVSIESTEYAKATVCVLDDCIKYLKENNLPDFYRCTQTASGVEYALAFIKKEKLLDYISLYDNRPEVERTGNENEDEDTKESILEHNLFGIHIKGQNNALSQDDPHICIGWSDLGDLSNINSKEELDNLHKSVWPDAKVRAKGQAVGQIYRFIKEAQIGDYVIYGDGSTAHIGIITSNYYYNDNPTLQDSDYVNNRSVEWKKDVSYADLSIQFKNSLGSAMSFFKLNDYKSVVYDLLNDTYEKDDEETDLTDSDVFGGFQDWLTSSNNPDYTGKQQYSGYSYCLKRLIDFMFSNGIIEDNNLNELNSSKYVSYLEKYEASNEAKTYDKDKLQASAGRAALKKYINYIEYLLKPYYSYKDCTGDGNNLVVYGTPGCGKSYYVDHTILGKDKDGKYVGEYKEENVIRTTFFQDYSNTDFVGQVMPVITTEVNDAGIEEQVVTYRFVPGPFTLALECAIAHPNEKVALVIEELNRGNAPSIFGDLFQLLDRIDEDGKEYPVGTSEYGITNVNIINYLSDNKHYDKKWRYSFNLSEIRIPANLYIFATMNTSDQNVFTLDTAFKRRWEFKKLKNEFTADHAYSGYKVPGMPDVTWKKLVDDINDFIVSDADAIASEDKQIGVYFVAKNMLCSSEKDCDDEQKKLKFAYKLFEYLWDDVAKFSRANWFGDVKTLDKLIEKYLTDGIKVFKDGVIKNNQ